MQANRRARLQSAIQQELASVVSREIKDPRVPSVTFTAAEVTPDAGLATVFVSILGGARGATSEERDARMKECIAGLNSASGYLRRHLAKVLTVRHVPSLVFREDRGFENAHRVQELLLELSRSEPAPAESGAIEPGAKPSSA